MDSVLNEATEEIVLPMFRIQDERLLIVHLILQVTITQAPADLMLTLSMQLVLVVDIQDSLDVGIVCLFMLDEVEVGLQCVTVPIFHHLAPAPQEIDA